MAKDDFKQLIDELASQCIAVRMRLLNRAITNLYDEALRPVGLKVSQANILVATGMLGVARPAVVCDLLHMDASTLSRNVERMRARGWLEVAPDEEDARAQPFRLTKAGRAIIERSKAAWENAQQKAAELLGAEGVAAIASAAKKLAGRP
jgi:DNA-binding MarR family transcriptional regulator